MKTRRKPIRPNERNVGMTAVEILVATTLSTLMMTLLLGVLGSISKQQKVFRKIYPTESWQTALEKQIRWDLENSKSIEVHPNRLKLSGYASRDFFTGESTYRPTEIVYSVTRDRFRHWLVRRESHLDELTNRNARTQLICSDVSRIKLKRLEMENELERDDSKEIRELSSDGDPVPNGLRVMLFAGESKTPWYSKDIILR